MKTGTNAFPNVTAFALVSCMASVGCGTTQPPRELVDARAAYQEAQNSRAPKLDPASLHEAKVQLDKAENAFDDDGASQRAKDLAYIAARKAELAQVSSETAYKENQLKETERQRSAAQKNQAQQSTADLQDAKQKLEQEQAARQAAEARAREAMQKLAAANTKVREEPRGTIITLPGTVLFRSGEAQLLPTSQTKLMEVVTALKDQDKAQIEVEGHTDSQGSYDFNMELSKRRAQSVADFFSSHGIERERVSVAGYGSSQPVADNSTPAGRADNRRVEIVVKHGGQQ